MRKIGFDTNFTMFLLVFVLAILLCEGTSLTANLTAGPEIFVVTNVNDQGPGSLRQAITAANANTTPGTDKIVFNIPGPGVKVISLQTPLPEITDSLIIHGVTQPGYAGAPLIELDGTNVGLASGLVITAPNTYVSGLAIGGFQGAGIVLRSHDGNSIQANYIGVDATGTVARPNNIGIQVVPGSRNNMIGAPYAGTGNVISGNLTHGVELAGNDYPNLVQGNLIGTNAAGTAAIANGISGIKISSPNNLIGGTYPGSGNLISGNSIAINISAPGNTIQGNLIGTDITGTSKVPNGDGIQALEVPNTVIGGLTPEARNVISGNDSSAIAISGNGSKVQGNFIGTDITGNLALGNAHGVLAGRDALIGGNVPEARNVIAGNSYNIMLTLSSGAIVQGNYIGTDVTGTRALGRIFGILIVSDNNSITQNVISGNSVAITLGQEFRFSQGNNNVIQGNIIGLNAQGTAPLPNLSGITIDGISNNNTITANTIAFNGSGVRIAGGTGNSIRGNSIFSNDGLGIDLGPSNVTLNDPTDGDGGANNLQNFPVITSVLSVGSSTTIQGSLNSTPNTTFQIDLYSNTVLDPSGFGEGALFFGATAITTDVNGNATINVTFPMPLVTGRAITATATDPNGNTSEFSAGDVSSATGSVRLGASSITVIEDVGFVTVTVERLFGISGSLTIDYATSDGTATAGQDYIAASGTLTFSGGETRKSFQIPIIDDAVTEPDETFTIELRNPPSPGALGTPSRLVVTIEDRSRVPVISRSGDSVTEGGTGTTTNLLVAFVLSAATGRSVSVDYATADLSATGGASCSNGGTDYESRSGTVSIPPGQTSVIIPIKVCGDTSAEADETFVVNLSNPTNGTLHEGQPLLTILNDDVLQLLLEEAGPTVKQAAALDALFFTRDTFPVAGIPEWFPTASDRNTRVMFFVRNLELNPGESPAAVLVELKASNGEFFNVPAEDVRPVPNVDFAQAAIRLPDTLRADVYTVRISAHSQISNPGTIRVAP